MPTLILTITTKVIIYTGPFCNDCDSAKRLLARNNIQYKEINIANVEGAMDEMIKKAKAKRTVPQIFINDKHIGGFDDVRVILKKKINYKICLNNITQAKL